jgi:ribosomal protein S18 acetylase RimI-like enzyme
MTPCVEGAMVGAPALRVLGTDDWAAWRALRLAALATDPAAFGSRLADWQGAGDREERWRGRLALAGSHNLLAELDGVPVGMASGIPGEDPAVRELISMWVAPSARGRGVGDALVAAVVAWARAGGAAGIGLAVVVGNDAAVGLYSRHGFAFTGEVAEPSPDGRREARLLYRFAG